ncbi:hypothetical protein GM415_02235 [Pseudodesulfovibrio cashew]|uniref:4Fe4S-binding SPASM domain-containing protein n=1 Tax=Pseudodesulfovibrio cashew TaxID=2678688 RepID=A0A6I6JF14_9BACT|nr:SPASM domain-containing protein [Pseudodesulfovibrio cashew]QGY39002.1 hypothetical protein GM415_02235 [Pseudodesulfovibrio cashew]
MDVFDRIIEVTKPIAKGYILNLFGEPTFHPRFSDLLEKTRGFSTWLSSHLNYEEGRAHKLAMWDHLRIICSIDTLDAFEYPNYRVGGDYVNVLRNLDILANGACDVFPQFLVPSVDIDREPYIQFARQHGIPEENVILKVKLENFRLDPTSAPSPGKCHSPYMGLYFNCDGYLVPCCNNVNSALHMAHISQINSVVELYAGGKGEAVRKALAVDKNCFDSCGRCDGMRYWDTEFVDDLRAVQIVFTRLLKSDRTKIPQAGSE